MDNTSHRFQKRYQLLMWIVPVLIVSLGFSGCETMRRKFVRQKKKKETAEFIPVLEPIEYPGPV